MFSARNKAKRLSSVKHSAKTSHHHHHWHHHIFETSARNGDRRVLKFVMIVLILLGLSVIFADGGGWRVTKLVIFCGRNKCMTHL